MDGVCRMYGERDVRIGFW